MSDVYDQVLGAERQENSINVATANTDTQVILVPWSAANKQGILEKLVISNQQAATDAKVKFFDEDITTTGTSGTNKPTARGTAAAATLMPWYDVPAGSQLIIGAEDCPNVRIQGGLACQSTVTTVQIYAQVIVY